jgi:hypothetical protein
MTIDELNNWMDRAHVVTAPGLDFGIRRAVGICKGTKVEWLDGTCSDIPWVPGRIARLLSPEEKAEILLHVAAAL